MYRLVIPQMSGSVVMNELSDHIPALAIVLLLRLMIEKSVRGRSPRRNDPNSVKMFGSSIPA